MATYDPNFTPVADLERKREAEARRQERLARRETPDYVKNAGTAFMRGGQATPASLARKHTALTRWNMRENDRLAKVESQLYGEQADALQSDLDRAATTQQNRLGRAADMRKQGLIGKQQRGLQELRGEQQLELETMRGELAKTLAGMKGVNGRRKTGLPSTKDMLTARNQLFEQFYGKGRGGKQLRDKYQGDFDKYVDEIMGAMSPPPPAQNALPALPADPSYGTITRGGQVIAAQVAGQTVDPEQYASQLKASLPGQAQAQPVVEQPTRKIQATLPQVEDIDYEIPEMFTEADRIPGVSRVLPQRTQKFIAGTKRLGKDLLSPVDLKKKRELTRPQSRMQKSFIRERPY